MKNLLLPLIAAALAFPAAAVDAKYREELAKHWTTSKELTIAVAEAMPAEHYEFKPNAEEMGYGELMVHLATANANNFALVAGIANPITKPSENTRDAVVKYLKDTFDFCLKTLPTITDEQFDALTGPKGRPGLSGRERLWSYFTHTAHHRGQAEVYLRVKGIRPPLYRF